MGSWGPHLAWIEVRDADGPGMDRGAALGRARLLGLLPVVFSDLGPFVSVVRHHGAAVLRLVSYDPAEYRELEALVRMRLLGAGCQSQVVERNARAGRARG